MGALRLKEENGAKIRQVEDHWRNQLLNITDQYDQLKKLNEDEYHAAMTKVNGYYASFEKIEGVCSDRKNCLLKCYQDKRINRYFVLVKSSSLNRVFNSFALTT